MGSKTRAVDCTEGQKGQKDFNTVWAIHDDYHCGKKVFKYIKKEFDVFLLQVLLKRFLLLYLE